MVYGTFPYEELRSTQLESQVVSQLIIQKSGKQYLKEFCVTWDALKDDQLVAYCSRCQETVG